MWTRLSLKVHVALVGLPGFGPVVLVLNAGLKRGSCLVEASPISGPGQRF